MSQSLCRKEDLIHLEVPNGLEDILKIVITFRKVFIKIYLHNKL